MVQNINSQIANHVPQANTGLKVNNPSGLKLAVGQKFEAFVIAQEGESYLLEVGNTRLYARSESPMSLGVYVALKVIGNKDGVVTFQKVVPQEEEKEASLLQEMAKRFGVTGKSVLLDLEKAIARIPVEESTALRFILDPNLLLGLLIPAVNQEDILQRIEINHSKKKQGSKETWEVVIALELEHMGNLEIIMKMVEKNIYTRIWPQSPDTETLLKGLLKEMTEISSYIEIIPPGNGPIVVKENLVEIDVII